MTHHVPFDDLPPAEQEQIRAVRDRVAHAVVQNATRALRSAGLKATVEVTRIGDRVEISVHSALAPDRQQRAEEIVEAVRTATLLSAAGMLH